MPLVLFLALRDLRHDWIAALCFVAAMTGVLAPMLILLALKTGAIDVMVDRLVEDPANRELVAVGAGLHDDAFFRWAEGLEETGFIVPATRSINAMADVVATPDGRRVQTSVPLVASAPGDPLLASLEDGTAPIAGRVWLSAPLAAALDSGAGESIALVIGRRIDGRDEVARATLQVGGVVPIERYSRQALFLSLPDLLAVERFRDDPATAAGSWREQVAVPQTYASFRLYARTLSGLGTLAKALEARGVAVRPRAENALLLLRFREVADRIYTAMALTAGLGFWAAMAANLRGMVERRRLALSLLRILGLPTLQRLSIPLVQSLALVMTGLMFSLAIVLPAIALTNAALAGWSEGNIARLDLSQIGATACLVSATAVTAAVWAMSGVAGIRAEEVLRHG